MKFNEFPIPHEPARSALVPSSHYETDKNVVKVAFRSNGKALVAWLSPSARDALITYCTQRGLLLVQRPWLVPCDYRPVLQYSEVRVKARNVLPITEPKWKSGCASK